MFEIEPTMLPFLLIFSLGIALFHTLILGDMLTNKLKPKWLMFVLDPLIILIGYFLFPKQSGIIFIGLFLSVFILGILLFISEGIKDGIGSFKEARTKNIPVWKILGSGILSILVLVLFFSLGIYSFFLIIFILILGTILPSNKNRFYFYQRTLPTSTIKGIAMGLSEISGKAKAITAVISPYTKTRCVCYIYTIDEVYTSTDSDGKKTTSYKEIQREEKLNNFLIEDPTGEIEIIPEKLEWINIKPSYQEEFASHRYTEYTLSEDTQFLLIGQAFYEGAKPVFRFDQNNKVFGIAPLDAVNFSNKWRPLKLKAITVISCIGIICAFILITPMRLEGNRLIIESLSLRKSSFFNHLNDIFNFFNPFQ
ncbi:hypothetical protein [Chryseobacterium sp.]|uniref:hypothetical protein n=1 Tax=Chryseobacterium sp. TaxID=1871047 RepID=UPI0025BD67C2|nr:hypothetical protein [Chryseobacterium sp.]